MLFVIYKKLTASQNKRVQIIQSTMSKGKHRNITVYIMGLQQGLQDHVILVLGWSCE
jgi:hypothetical protein